ncbi:hypothetical protein D621_17775 [beta proteobacterium AAP51]|nr:hypothetical protein D621_17775 [beta proteobacterium AAP51]
MTSLVSIIIPVFNCEAYVAEAVESALAQDYPDKEVIVVNDGSTDGTLQVLQGFGSRIRVVDQVNGGPPRARNAGLAAARGDYVAFLDADDIWLQGKLSAQVAHMQANPEVGTCYITWLVWPADGDGVFRVPAAGLQPLGPTHVNPSMSGWIYGRLLFDSELLTSTVLIRTSVLKQVGEFDEALWNGDDYDFWLRLSQAAPISRLEPAGVLYRVVQGSVSRRARPVNDELVVIERALARFGLRDPSGAAIDPARVKQRLDGLVFQFGYAHLRRGDPAIAWRSFAQNLRFRPLRPRLWVHALTALVKSLGASSATPRA